MIKLSNGWSEEGGKLVLYLKCQDFSQALALLNSIGDIAEAANHHPDLCLKDYNQLMVTTTTHDAKSLTDKDYDLAQKISSLIEGNTKNKKVEVL